MDLIISYKSRFRLWIVWIFLVVGLCSSFANAWRISQKCPHGHYYNDGCTACWCDVRTGQTKCEKLPQCTNHVKCPRGRQYKDSCGNDCTCYESSGTVLCNEKRKCPQEIPAKAQVSNLPSSSSNNMLLRRSGITAPYIPPVEEHPLRFRFPNSTPTSQIRSSSFISTARYRNNGYYENIAIASTPHPHVRIPSSGKSEELIIEPAIIIRKKGSNKASIVRNPSYATSVSLPSSRHRNQDHEIIFNKMDSSKSQPSSYSSTSRSSSLAPLLLYEKQLQTIMNIRRAYSQLLRSKVNFNFQIATGKVPSSVTSAPPIPITADHPRRFDSDFENSTILMNTTPSPPIFMTSQQPKPQPDNIQVKPFQPLVWRNEIKNVLKQFSPVPPLKQFVSYVSTSTENYLRDFLNKNRLQNPILQYPQESSTISPPPSESRTYPPPESRTYPPQTVPPPSPPPLPPPLVSYPFHPFSTIESFDDHQFDPSNVPIHEVYQNHDLQMLASTSTPQPTPHSYPGHNSYFHKTLSSPTFEPKPLAPHNRDQFPFMKELMQEIARLDNVPSSTPKYTPSLTALPTFHTPGPPYAEIHELQPLSILPKPQPEPATPTRRNFVNTAQQHPTVRVNLDKPIYINSPPQQPQHSSPQQRFPPPPQQPLQYSPQQRFPPRFQQPQHPSPHQHRFHPLHPSLLPHHTNRRIYSIPHRPHSYVPPPLQQPTYFSQPIQKHYTNQEHNVQYRPLVPQYFIPRPKQYRLVLKGNVRDAAVRVDDVVPRFVSKIAQEFFKKPEIYVPKIRPGKPLTLEKVILNHKEIVPSEMSFGPTPGAPPTKLRFTPQAQWEMREELAKQGIMLNEPLTAGIRDYVANDPSIMEMDAPMKAVQTWETHSSMGMGTMNDYPNGGRDTSTINIPQLIQQTSTQLQNQQLYNPILLPTAIPPQVTLPPPTLDHQHQQDIQHQISSSIPDFKVNNGDFNDFKHDGQHAFPPELQIPGIEQVVVDKYLVHDPLDPSGAIQMFSSTTVQPPTINKNADLSSLLNLHRSGLPALPAHGPTPSPAVLVRHHGAPTPVTTPSPLQTQAPSILASTYPSENFLVTIINSTPQPFVTTTITSIENPPSILSGGRNEGLMEQTGDGTGIASQINDFLSEQMDFGARPQLNLYDLLFQHRTGDIDIDDGNADGNKNIQQESEINYENKGDKENDEPQDDRQDQMATETKVSSEDSNVDTDKLANIFSLDYKNKYNRKPPAVIVIKVPPDHSDGPFPKVVEKRRGEGTEVQKIKQHLKKLLATNSSRHPQKTVFLGRKSPPQNLLYLQKVRLTITKTPLRVKKSHPGKNEDVIERIENGKGEEKRRKIVMKTEQKIMKEMAIVTIPMIKKSVMMTPAAVVIRTKKVVKSKREVVGKIRVKK